MFVKFMPNQLVSSVSGANNVVITVKNCIVLFCCRSICVWYSSRNCKLYSLLSLIHI